MRMTVVATRDQLSQPIGLLLRSINPRIYFSSGAGTRIASAKHDEMPIAGASETRVFVIVLVRK